jgi:hypothetical protein
MAVGAAARRARAQNKRKATHIQGATQLSLGAYLPPCAAICLDSQGASSDGAAERYLLSGTVAHDAEAIRVTLAGGRTATYPLVAPTVLDSDRRAFLLDLGVSDWRKLELFRACAAVATAQMPALTAAYEDCTDKLGPPPPAARHLGHEGDARPIARQGTAAETRSSQLTVCSTRARGRRHRAPHTCG